MSISDEADLLEFKAEAAELLDTAEKSLLAIDDGAAFKDTFDAAFRCFHNLKGAAGMMELTELQSHTHELETVLMGFKTAPSIPKDYVTYFLSGIDGARMLLDGQTSTLPKNPDAASHSEPSVSLTAAPTTTATTAKETCGPSDADILAGLVGIEESTGEFFAECDEIIDRVAGHLAALEAEVPVAESKERVDALYRDFHSLKGSAYLFNFRPLGDIAHLIESTLEPVRDGARVASKSLINGIFGALKLVELEVDSLRSKKENSRIRELTATLAQALGTIAAGLPAASIASAPPVPALAPAPAPAPTPAEPMAEKARDEKSRDNREGEGEGEGRRDQLDPRPRSPPGQPHDPDGRDGPRAQPGAPVLQPVGRPGILQPEQAPERGHE